MPAVPLPGKSSVRTPLDFKLKSGWRYLPKGAVFETDSGERFSVDGDLPAGSRIVYKVPHLARANAAKLNEQERDLRRYMQLILPQGESPAKYLGTVQDWPCVEEAHVAPEVSLPRRTCE